ncbi:hypothetical protein BAT_0974 [Bacillus pumilus ATCC 7061]|nr:hypothetical protein BAT_0974 [Bacillus pumilus ATCC 7061]
MPWYHEWDRLPKTRVKPSFRNRHLWLLGSKDLFFQLN